MLPLTYRERAFFALLLISCLVSVAVVMHSGTSLRFADEVDYYDIAKHVREGHGYVNSYLEPTAYRPPGYPLFMVPFVNLNQGILILKILNVLFLVFSALLMRMIVARETPAVAWLTGAIALAYPVWIYTASTLYPQTLCLALLLAHVCLITRPNLSWKSIVLSGVLYGFLILTAPAFLLLLPVFGGYILVREGSYLRLNLAFSVLFGLSVVVAVSPWAVRNYKTFDQFVPVSTNGGVNLLIGNNKSAQPNSGVNVDISQYLKQSEGLNEARRSQVLQGFALDWIRNNPVSAAKLYFRKVMNYFNFRTELATKQNQAKWNDWVIFVTYYPLLILVAIRLALMRRIPLSGTEKLLICAYLLNAFAAAIFFTRIRFRLPFDGLLMSVAIISIGHLWSLRNRPNYASTQRLKEEKR